MLDVQFTADTLFGAAPLAVNFSNNSIHAISYSWDFGDGNGSTLDEPQHTFELDGTFTVVLSGLDAQGCSDRSQVTILVFDDTQIYIPNSFTPNGDGINENFNIYSNKTKLQISGMIFNRWGREIASWNSLTKGWDGKSKGGSEAEEGIYVYLVKITFPDGDAEERHGSVALIR